jgi:phosphocarrier protein
MQQREIEIVNKLGLHARASAKLTQLAAKYQCDVSLARNGRKVNAKSIMGVMMLAAGKGSRITLETDGPDETEAMDAIVVLIGDCGSSAGNQCKSTPINMDECSPLALPGDHSIPKDAQWRRACK